MSFKLYKVGRSDLHSHSNAEVAEDDNIKKCVDNINETCIPFHKEKTHLLASSLGIESEVGDCQSYKQICLRWLEVKGTDHCTLGQLTIALFKSELARLVSRLRPICKLVFVSK